MHYGFNFQLLSKVILNVKTSGSISLLLTKQGLKLRCKSLRTCIYSCCISYRSLIINIKGTFSGNTFKKLTSSSEVQDQMLKAISRDARGGPYRFLDSSSDNLEEAVLKYDNLLIIKI